MVGRPGSSPAAVVGIDDADEYSLPRTQPPKRARAARGKTQAKAKAKQPASQRRRSGRAATKVSDADIRAGFGLFAIPRDELDEDAELGDESDEDGAYDGDAGVMPIRDVRRCLTALKLPKAPPDFFPESQTHISSAHFLLLAQTLRDSGTDEDDDVESESDVDVLDDGDAEEAAQAFALFTHKRSVDAPDTRITLADLRRVARELREEVDDNILKMMIEEANGGSAGNGVGMDEFVDIMKRAGMLS